MTIATTDSAVARRAEAVGAIEQVRPTLSQMIDRMRPEIARALPKHMDADRMARIALTLLRQTPKLNDCTPESFLGALMTCSQLGMEPGPTQEAYIIPRWNKDADNGLGANGKPLPKGAMEASFQLGYQGMVKLFWQHPLAAMIDAQAVHANDEFEFELGTNAHLFHRPAKRERGNVVCWYSIAKLTNGGLAFRVMYPAEVEQHRARSQAPNSPAWKSSYDEMAKKTCIRAMFKLLPKSAEIAQALAHDETIRTDSALDAIDAPQLESIPDRPMLSEADAEAERDRLWALIQENAPDDWDHERIEKEFEAGFGAQMAQATVEQLDSLLARVRSLRGAS